MLKSMPKVSANSTANPTPTSDLTPEKRRVLSQLKRSHGQLSGVIKMYEQDRPCVDVVRQIIATRNALSRTAREFLINEVGSCSRDNKPINLETVLKELFR